ncbi:hypothetical protein ACFQ0G_43850 [Streptomyces chiangmaiensis]
MDFAVHIGGQGCRLDGVGKFGEEHSRVHVVGCDQDYTGDGQRLSLRAYAAKHSKGASQHGSQQSTAKREAAVPASKPAGRRAMVGVGGWAVSNTLVFPPFRKVAEGEPVT